MKIKNSGRGHAYEEQDIIAVTNAMRDADPYTQGKYQTLFENDFSTYLGSNIQSFAVSSGTAALELAAILSGLNSNDEVIIPAHTFCATAIPFARTGAKIVWADINETTFVASVDSIEELVTSRTKVIVAVHLYGLMVDMNRLMGIAEQHNILVVEDCAQALGAEIDGKKAGTFGDFSCFSFHSHKVITTLGEGGMLGLKSVALSKQVHGLKHNGLRSFGERKEYWKPAMSNVDFDINGFWPYNFCIGEIQCAVGASLLNRIDSLLQNRMDRANQIIKGLKDFPELKFQFTPIGYKNTHYTLPAFVDPKYGINNDSIINLLHRKYNITAVVQYYPLYRYPMFIKAKFEKNNCSKTDLFFDNMISFPNHDEITSQEVNYLIESVKSVIKELR